MSGNVYIILGNDRTAVKWLKHLRMDCGNFGKQRSENGERVGIDEESFRITTSAQTAFFFKIFFFWRGPFLKSLLNLLQYCFCFMFLVFWPQGMWDLSSPTRDQTGTPRIGRWSLNHWPAREVPPDSLYYSISDSLSLAWVPLSTVRVKHRCYVLPGVGLGCLCLYLPVNCPGVEIIYVYLLYFQCLVYCRGPISSF